MALKHWLPWKRKPNRAIADRCAMLEQEIQEYMKLDKERCEKIVASREKIMTLRTERDFKGMEADRLHDIAVDFDAQASECADAVKSVRLSNGLAWAAAVMAQELCEESPGFARIAKETRESILAYLDRCIEMCLQADGARV